MSIAGSVRRGLWLARLRAREWNLARALRFFRRGYGYGTRMAPPAPALPSAPTSAEHGNPLEAYVDAHTQGAGIFKWRHYFDAYDRHLARFRGRPVHVLEIGLLGGGSIDMWREYFGADTHVYGVDVDERCRSYEREGVEIFIGDQADPQFWREFLAGGPVLDVVIDDGGHEARQQAVTLECLLPHIRPGGVYVCEDVHGPFHFFHSFVDGLTRPLNRIGDAHSPRPASGLHQHVASVHRYPNMVVIEKPATLPRFEAPRRGTQWLEGRQRPEGEAQIR